MEIDHHVGTAMSGLVADALTLVDSARVNAANHQYNYGEPMSVIHISLCLLIYRQKVLHNQYPKSCYPSAKMKIPKWYSFCIFFTIVSSFWRSSHHRRLYKEERIPIVRFRNSWFLLRNRFLTDSSGTYTEYKAVSIGAGSEGATDMLKDLYRPVGFLDGVEV